jgi:hypothetical protein
MCTSPAMTDKNDNEKITAQQTAGAWPKRIGLALLFGAVLCFVWPQFTGSNEIAGIGNVVIGRVLLFGSWIPLILGLYMRSKAQKPD